jgi:hypothetical protein
MTIAITTIQRNRNPWIVEWLAFHLLAGYDQFFVYCHQTDDGMTETLERLAQHYPITLFTIETEDRPQLAAFGHALEYHLSQVNWMAFIDGDEFLFPTAQQTIGKALAEFEDHSFSALGVYWKCYGSNGHIQEPDGLILENYPGHSAPEFGPNRHIKSILRGGEKAETSWCSHFFETEKGTVDELLRPIHGPSLADPDQQPSYQHFRINHYVTQSHDYFRNTKQHIGAADRGTGIVRPDEWFTGHDRYDYDDGVAKRFLPALRDKVTEMERSIR